MVDGKDYDRTQKAAINNLQLNLDYLHKELPTTPSSIMLHNMKIAHLHSYHQGKLKITLP